MFLWIALYAAGAVINIICVVFLVKKIQHFNFVRKLSCKKTILMWLIPLAMLVIWGLVLALFFDVVNIVICFAVLILSWILCDLIFWVIKKLRSKKICPLRLRSNKNFKHYYQGVGAVLLASVYLCFGFYCAHNIVGTHYTIQNTKNDAKMRIVQISDSHLGLVLKSNKFYNFIETLNAQKPDLVVITGDFVDDDTTLQDLSTGCDALSKINARLGVWYVYGNHDKGYFSDAAKGWTDQDLVDKLSAAGVHIMEDDVAALDKNFTLIGRKDASGESGQKRKSAQSLMDGQDADKFSIMLDHQPKDYDAQAACGVDLVLSGHTHGGQLFPINWSVCVLGKNCMVYGYKKQENTNFIVSSGIGDWKVQFKTGCLAEYVVIDIE